MNAIANITITLSDGTKKSIDVKDNMVLILNGRAKKFKAIEECSVKELLINADGKNGRS